MTESRLWMKNSLVNVRLSRNGYVYITKFMSFRLVEAQKKFSPCLDDSISAGIHTSHPNRLPTLADTIGLCFFSSSFTCRFISARVKKSMMTCPWRVTYSANSCWVGAWMVMIICGDE